MALHRPKRRRRSPPPLAGRLHRQAAGPRLECNHRHLDGAPAAAPDSVDCAVPLPVLSCCTYLTDVDGVAWRGRDYDAHDFICAIKEKLINMFAQVPVRGILRRLDDSN